MFEEFTQKLADDVGKGDTKGEPQLHQFTHFKGTMYDVAANQSRIGYYVTLLKKEEGLGFVKKYRLPLFLQSELYAEYKLSKHLSMVQVHLLISLLVAPFGKDLQPEIMKAVVYLTDESTTLRNAFT